MAPLPWTGIQKRAAAFARRWADAGRERSEAQPFLLEFLEVFGVDDPAKTVFLEHPVQMPGGRGSLDCFWKNHIAIEMKSRGGSLDDAMSQLAGYMENIPPDEIPDLWMASDFETVRLWRRDTRATTDFRLGDLRRHIKRFAVLADHAASMVRDPQVEVNVKAALKMAALHDHLKVSGYQGHDLEVYLVRLLYCLFAEGTDIFPKDALYHYFRGSRPDGGDLSARLGQLFETLDLAPEAQERMKPLPDELRQFQYVKGLLFAERPPTARFDGAMRKLLLECIGYDWEAISPAIFGAMFQGVMDKDKRRDLGAHYTSEENILKVINPLFMDGLRRDLGKARGSAAALDKFHSRIAGLKFLDPACGCGNFLIIAYRELRLLELELLKARLGPKERRPRVLNIESLCRVSVEQFGGIELEDWPCQIAQAGMWLMDHQMNMRVSEAFGDYYARLPLGQGASIVCGNALRMDWGEVVPREDLSFILGNPPFGGARVMGPRQKEDMRLVFGGVRGMGNMDYVAAWYRKAAAFMQGTAIQAAFVSTSSITQGEQPALLWKPLLEQGVSIHFGHRAFKWRNEAPGQAAVHCVIFGFHARPDRGPKNLYDEKGHKAKAKNINPYLTDAPAVFLHGRSRPVSRAPEMVFSSMPNDGGNLLLGPDEKRKLEKEAPEIASCLRPFMGAREFVNGIRRYCLWLLDTPPRAWRSIPAVADRVAKVRAHRESSKREGTRRLSVSPALFGEIRQTQKKYVLIPSTTSLNRLYIPMGFMKPEVIASNATHIIPGATAYHFGILTSMVHMAWTRVVCGRLEVYYRYSKDIVYNIFPWPEASPAQEKTVAGLAQAVLDVRDRHPGHTLADLYDQLSMPADLLKAHRALDRAVMKLYGFPATLAEPAIVAALMERHRQLAGSRQGAAS